MNAILTKYLKDFSAPPPPPVEDLSFPSTFSLDDGASSAFSFEPEPVLDIEAERKAAFDEGYAEAEAAGEQAQEAAMAEERQKHAVEMADLVSRHEQGAVAMIHTRFHEMTNEVAQALAERTLQVLLPLLGAQLAERAVKDLHDLAQQVLKDRETAHVTVRGDARLISGLKPLFEADGVEVRYIENHSIDLTVEIDDAVLVTRLETWAHALAEVAE
ncbi:hypothetical protein M2360_001851 [Rhizobium sp. SG_E_25_P2]|uniref:hypothetical protein n=1 Tax=Rhizobium sp. SG_E_25_P2 TaxID=2879942 RepID=UPI002476225D|nr:hypothetical protein [Rhizobium sp. SG_E_25_P2]MDH6266455.1 hypothetical protein [Rhizobium sp. SG_E_25_P2]